MIQAREVSISYADSGPGPLKVLNALTFHVPTGAFVTFVGPSGCGKSTLLRCIAGLLEPNTGQISLAGEIPAQARRDHRIAFVFQKPIFFDWLSVQENAELLAAISKRRDASEQVAKYLTDFGLAKYAKAFPRELSGGMLTRVALARALAQGADYLLLDEAFDHLDEALRAKINTHVQSYWIEHGPTVVAVTHNIAEAVWLSDTVYVLSMKPSRVTARFDIPFRRPRKISDLNSLKIQKIVRLVRKKLEEAYAD